MADSFYSTQAWKKLRAKVRAHWRAFDLPCGVCGQPIDFSEKGGSIVDHIVSRRVDPSLALEPSNLQLVHSRCNTYKARNHNDDQKAASVEIGLDGFPPGWLDS